MLFEVLQILVGIVVVYVIYIISTIALASDGTSGIRMLQSIRKHTVILNGTLDSMSSNNRSFATTPNTSGTNKGYLHLPRSINRIGGAQFTYSVWVYLKSHGDLHSGHNKRPYYVADTSVEESTNARSCPSGITNAGDIRKDYTLFLKGDDKPYVYEKSGVRKVGRWTVCPQVMLRDDGEDLSLVVRMNTLHEVDTEVKIQVNHSDDYKKNEALLTLMEGSWTMISVVVMDDIALEGFERGTLVKIYLNNTLYEEVQLKGNSIVDNDGDFFFFPDGAVSGKSVVKMTTMSHYNYALSDQEIHKRYDSGFETKKTADIETNTNHPTYSPKNKTDEYN